jgi:hypothetical protein
MYTVMSVELWMMVFYYLNFNSLMLNLSGSNYQIFENTEKRSTSELAVLSAALLQQFIHYLFDFPWLIAHRSLWVQTHHSTQLFRGACLTTSAFKNISWESKPERN